MADKVISILSKRPDMFGFSEYFLASLERELRDTIDREELAGQLGDAIVHCVFPGGKRIRPLTMAAFVTDCGKEFREGLGCCVSLELLHTASLIHDDLPALDNDDLRRGKPTCHKLFGEATAVLAGDSLVALANKAVIESDLAPDLALKVSALHSSAFIRLCNGQELDLKGADSKAALLELHAEKTGALFGAALASAAHLVGFSDPIVATCEELGVRLGVYFQLVDDALDVFGSDAQRGRSGSSDARNAKKTLCNLLNEAQAMEVIMDARKSVYELTKKIENQSARSMRLLRQVYKSVDERLEDCLPKAFDRVV